MLCPLSNMQALLFFHLELVQPAAGKTAVEGALLMV
jgi:hypothetical protein